MTQQTAVGVVDLDDNTAAWLDQYRNALAKIKEWQEVADVARSHLESAIGENEVAMYKNRQVIRFTRFEQTRFDVKHAKEILPPQILDVLNVKSTVRRFTLVEE
jgi:predicted phage-related endonuclease